MTDIELAEILYEYMRREDPVEKADCIIGFGNHNLSTAQHAAELFLQGWAPQIVFSGGLGKMTKGNFVKPEAELYAEIAMGMGVPSDRILKEMESTNSGENVLFTQKILKQTETKAQTILLVHVPYMLRRAYATLMAQWVGRKPKVLCSGVKDTLEEFCVREHEDPKTLINLMVGDVQRMREFPKHGWQIAQDIPEEVWTAYEELVRRGYVEHVLH